MLRNLRELEGYQIGARDGKIGSVDDFLFDDDRWVLRYLVVATGGLLARHRVLIYPPALDTPDWTEREFPTHLTRAQIQDAPDTAADPTVTLIQQERMHRHFGWNEYWPHDDYYGYGTVDAAGREAARHRSGALRSWHEMKGYRLHARDGEIGSVYNMLLEDGPWVIRYLEIDTGGWLPGKKVLMAPGWIRLVNWYDRELFVDRTREEIRNAPAYPEDRPVDRALETELHDYYAVPGYWGM